jgi:hypothetical protein
MAALKIAKFLGTAPRNASEHLADTAASVARNCKLYSGDLIPMPAPAIVANAGRTGPIKTLYALRDPAGGLKWLSWAAEVSVVTPATDVAEEQRFFYSGDGRPKVSTYALATAGAGPYPSQFYDLGLPLPSAVPTATPAPFSPATSVSVTRDTGQNVTLATAAPHNLRSGATITVTGFTFLAGSYTRDANGLITCTIDAHGLISGASVVLVFTSGSATSNRYPVTVTSANTFTCQDTASGATSGNVNWDIRDLNTTTEVTVLSPTSISYYAAGVAFASTASPKLSSSGRVSLGDQIQARSYVYTWFTPWGEESIGSEPSTAAFVQEGQVIVVSGLPSTPPAGSNFVRAIRLYRTQAGTTTDAEYLRLATLWFPNPITRAARANNVATLTTMHAHGLLEGDRVKVAGIPTFNAVDAVVVSIPTSTTFTIAQTAVDAPVASVSGTLYYDVSENPPASAARYWGETSFDFIDDFSFRSLLGSLDTADYEPPPANLAGLTVMQNNILAGFVGNDLYFSEPNVFHAWPAKYKRSFESAIVGLAQVGGRLLVLTEGFPFVVEGSDPAIVSVARLSARYPCLAARSIVETSFGVVWATHDGLAVYSPANAAQLLTKSIHSSDTWTSALDPATIVATLHKDGYLASHSTAALMFEAGGNEIPAFFVDIQFTFTAAWRDTLAGVLYLVSGTSGDIYRWDAPNQPAMVQRWKSKTFVMQNFTNFGAARVVADYELASGSPVWEDIDTLWEETDLLWDQADPLTFRLYANKVLVFTTTRGSSDVFRLPAGYKTDTYEVEVEGSIRVRAIHLGDTPIALGRV